MKISFKLRRPIKNPSHHSPWGVRLSAVGRDSVTTNGYFIHTRHLWFYTSKGARYIKFSWQVFDHQPTAEFSLTKINRCKKCGAIQ